jgi:hypothetical protein
MTSVVYFIQEGKDGPIKIGVSTQARLRSRVRELQTGNHRCLRLLGSFGGGLPEERRLHRELWDHLLGGEWFAPHPEVLAAVNHKRDWSGKLGMIL